MNFWDFAVCCVIAMTILGMFEIYLDCKKEER